MTSEDFQELRRTFERLVAASEEERASLIAELSESDSVLAGELKRMLAAYASRTSLLDQTATAPMAPDSVNFNRSAPVRPGSQIGSYVLESELGRGGMGVVYQARRADGSFQKQVAIKILRHDRIDALFLRRFHQERQILAQLNHPHIASILDGGETPDGDPYFVMEHVDGVPITAYCEFRGLSVDQKLELFLQICDAVQHAHRNLTVHRDFKPSNILVTDAGAVKLLDFGIAKLLQPELGEAPEPTAAVLTPEYASPEQIRSEPITTAADVFSLGILLYEMLSGEHPFRRKGALPHEVMRAICEDDPTPTSQVAPRGRKQLGGELDLIVLTALRKLPAWRYPSVEQLAEDIGRYRRGWPVLAKGDGLGYRFGSLLAGSGCRLAAATSANVPFDSGYLGHHVPGPSCRAGERGGSVRAYPGGAASVESRKGKGSLRNRPNVPRPSNGRLAEARTKEAETERRKERDRYRDVRDARGLVAVRSSRRNPGSGRIHHGAPPDCRQGAAPVGTVERRFRETISGCGAIWLRPMSGWASCGWTLGGRTGMMPAPPSEPTSTPWTCGVRSRTSGALPGDRRDLALSLAKLGDGQFMAGDTKHALESYQAAWMMARSLSRSWPLDSSMRRALGTIDERRCTVLLAAGDNAGARWMRVRKGFPRYRRLAKACRMTSRSSGSSRLLKLPTLTRCACPASRRKPRGKPNSRSSLWDGSNCWRRTTRSTDDCRPLGNHPGSKSGRQR